MANLTLMLVVVVVFSFHFIIFFVFCFEKPIKSDFIAKHVWNGGIIALSKIECWCWRKRGEKNIKWLLLTTKPHKKAQLSVLLFFAAEFAWFFWLATNARIISGFFSSLDWYYFFHVIIITIFIVIISFLSSRLISGLLPFSLCLSFDIYEHTRTASEKCEFCLIWITDVFFFFFQKQNLSYTFFLRDKCTKNR